MTDCPKPQRPSGPRALLLTLTSVATLALMGACQNEVPTSQDGSLVPLNPATVQVRLPFDAFATNVQVLSGFGRTNEFASLEGGPFGGFVGAGFGDQMLAARTLIRFGDLGDDVTIRDATGATFIDSDISFIGGEFRAIIDTIGSAFSTPVRITLGATDQRWDASTASWTHAIDSVGESNEWGEPGGGPARAVGEQVWDITQGDTVVFLLDSLTVRSFADTTDDSRGIRLTTADPGVLLRLQAVTLSVDIRPSANPDTIVTRAIPLQDLTFVYDPVPPPDQGELRVGGVPAWRTVINIELPEVVRIQSAVCGATAECDVALTSRSVNSAALILTTAVSPGSFRPQDSLFVDARAVLAPELLPKSPLGPTFGLSFGTIFGPQALGFRLPAAYFGDSPGAEVAISITGFIQDLIDGPDEDGLRPPAAVALLSVNEPASLAFATFEGLGTARAPELRLILTLGDEVTLR